VWKEMATEDEREVVRCNKEGGGRCTATAAS
jgi:hypothetical protein